MKIAKSPPRPSPKPAPGHDERMSKNDFRWFLVFVAVVLCALVFAVVGNA